MRYECVGGPKLSTYARRERAAEAFQLRASRHSWREICERLGCRSLGAAQSAANRHVERLRREPAITSFEAYKFAIETRTRALTQRFTAAYRAGDDDTLVTLNREIVPNEAELAKLDGLYEPQTVNVTVTQTPGRHQSDALAALVVAHDVLVHAAGRQWNFASPLDPARRAREGRMPPRPAWMTRHIGG
jgi:hypothetical protein